MIFNVIDRHISLVNYAHSLIKAKISSGSIAIDATVGNGYDTVFLLRLISPNGQVYGFDIQREAIEITHSRAVENKLNACLVLFNTCHAELKRHIPVAIHGLIDVIMFNLGYLPGSNKSVITKAQTTITALQEGIGLLASGGLMTVLAYPGHSGGQLENEGIVTWLLTLSPQHYMVNAYQNHADNPFAPILYGIEKIA